MEFSEVVRRRRMIREFEPTPLSKAQRERLLSDALRGPSAGFSQGFTLLVCETPQERARWWDAVRAGSSGLTVSETTTMAPLIVSFWSCKRAYLDRYAKPDKGWTDRDEARWPVPYWHIDTGFSALLMLLSAVDQDLGALFFGLDPDAVVPVRSAFGVPDDHDLVGVVAVGYPAASAERRDLRSRRRDTADQIRRGHW